jgi:hypothetical protein
MVALVSPEKGGLWLGRLGDSIRRERRAQVGHSKFVKSYFSYQRAKRDGVGLVACGFLIAVAALAARFRAEVRLCEIREPGRARRKKQTRCSSLQ